MMKRLRRMSRLIAAIWVLVCAMCPMQALAFSVGNFEETWLLERYSQEGHAEFNDVVVEVFSPNEQYAVIRSGESLTYNAISAGYAYNIIDRDNTCYGAFMAQGQLNGSNIYINNDGVVSLRMNSRGVQIILDKYGKVCLISNAGDGAVIDNSETYYQVAECGYTLRETQVSHFELGELTCIEVVQLDGTVVREVGRGTGVNIEYVRDDVYHISYTYGSQVSVLYDVLTGEKKPYEQYPAEPQPVTPADEQRLGGILNDRYTWCRHGIYTWDGEVVKVILEAQGIESAVYAGGYYCITTPTGWYYALDEDFNRIAEPVQFGERNDVLFTDYGIITNGTLYDFNGDIICLLNEKATPISFTYGNFNLYTRSYMKTSMPLGETVAMIAR